MRELTPGEIGCLNLLKIFEDACDLHRITTSTVAPKPTMELLHKLEREFQICRILKIEALKDQPEKYRVIFLTREFQKYIRFMLLTSGLKLCLDGSLIAKDGIVIPNTYSKV